MYITAQLKGPRLRNDLYCVKWDVKLYYTILYHTIVFRLYLYDTNRPTLSSGRMLTLRQPGF